MTFPSRSVINRAVSWLRSFDCDEIDQSSAIGFSVECSRATASHFNAQAGKPSAGYAGTATSAIAPSFHGSSLSIDFKSSCAGKSEICRRSRNSLFSSSIDISMATPDVFARSAHFKPSSLGISPASTSISELVEISAFAWMCVHAKKHSPSNAADRKPTPAPSAAHDAANVDSLRDVSPPNLCLVNK